MYCSGCGQALADGQSACPHCGRPVAVPIPPVPGLRFELENYAGKVKALGVVWLIYAGLSLLIGLAGVLFTSAVLSGHAPWAHAPWLNGPWMNGPWMNGPWAQGPWRHDAPAPFWLGPVVIRFLWLTLAVRVGLAVVTGWGLLQRAGWGRIVAIIAAILSLLRFPLGTALGIWTLILLLGYRNSTLYRQL